MDNKPSKSFENNGKNSTMKNIYVPPIECENRRKRKHNDNEEEMERHVPNKVVDKSLSISNVCKFKKEIARTTVSNFSDQIQHTDSSHSNQNRQVENLELSNGSNNKDLINFARNITSRSYNTTQDQPVHSNAEHSRIGQIGANELNALCDIQRNSHSTWHPFHHNLYIRQQLEMERRRASLLYRRTGNLLGPNGSFVGQIVRKMILAQPEEENLQIKKVIAKNSRILSCENAVNLDDTTCVICFMKYKEQEMIRELFCHHRFHMNCIDKWLINQMNCPICRLPLTNSLQVENELDDNRRIHLHNQPSLPPRNLDNQISNLENENTNSTENVMLSNNTSSSSDRNGCENSPDRSDNSNDDQTCNSTSTPAVEVKG